MVDPRLRAAEPADAAFLTDMVVAAINWRQGSDRSRTDILADPRCAHYVTGWMRPGDLGLVAVDDLGRPGGAAWLRRFTADDPGYGYVGDEVPELSMGVVRSQRGRGLGRALLRGLLAEADRIGLTRVSLSVERANVVAARMYAAAGFRTVGSLADADTMVLTLPGTGGGRQSGRWHR